MKIKKKNKKIKKKGMTTAWTSNKLLANCGPYENIEVMSCMCTNGKPLQSK